MPRSTSAPAPIFGVFIIGLLILSILLVASLSCLIIDAALSARRLPLLLAMLCVLGAPGIFFAAKFLADPVEFQIWAATHPGVLREAVRHAGVVMHWDAWGFGGSDNDAYIVSDPADRMGALPEAKRWRKRLGIPCEIVHTRRMRYGIYIATTYNCRF